MPFVALSRPKFRGHTILLMMLINQLLTGSAAINPVREAYFVNYRRAAGMDVHVAAYPHTIESENIIWRDPRDQVIVSSSRVVVQNRGRRLLIRSAHPQDTGRYRIQLRIGKEILDEASILYNVHGMTVAKTTVKFR